MQQPIRWEAIRKTRFLRCVWLCHKVCILNEDGTVKKIVAAHDVGKAVNPLSVEGQIEGGVIMSYGFALTEKYPILDCKPTAKYGTLGLPKANKIPEVESIIVEKKGLPVACGAIGIGEITSSPQPLLLQEHIIKWMESFVLLFQ